MDAILLARLAFFRTLSSSELDRMLALCTERQFGDGQAIVEEAQEPVGLFAIARGRARVSKSIGGKRGRKLAQLTEGDSFGEMDLVSDLPIATTVRAEGEVVCVHLPREQFRKLLDEDAAIARKVLRSVVDTLVPRLVRSDRRLDRELRRNERRAALAHRTALARMVASIALSYLWVFLRTRLLRWRMSPEETARIHRANARVWRETVLRLGGVAVEVGQLASTQRHVLPNEYIEELRPLRGSAAAVEYPVIASVIRSELGMGPLELFAEFDEAPIARSAIAQAHLAKRKTGEKVVVKVQHPGAQRSAAIDLAMMRRLFGVLARLAKIDLRPLLAEADEPLRRKVDLHLEGEATEAFRDELRPLGVVVPKVYWQLTSRRVLTVESIDGVNVDDADQMRAWKIDRRSLMQTYVRSFWHQVFQGGFFQIDPQQGTILATREGHLALVDFGLVKRLSDNVRSGLQKEIFGAVFRQPKLYVDGLVEKGMMDDSDRAEVEAWAKKNLRESKAVPLFFDSERTYGTDPPSVMDDGQDIFRELDSFHEPREGLLCMRALGIVVDVCKQVVPEEPASQLVMRVLLPFLSEFVAKNPEYVDAAASAVMQVAR